MARGLEHKEGGGGYIRKGNDQNRRSSQNRTALKSSHTSDV